MSKPISATSGPSVQFDADSTAPSSEPSIGFDLPDLSLEKLTTATATVPSGNTTAFYRTGMIIGGIREGHYTDF
jgi:hypothetical protein